MYYYSPQPRKHTYTVTATANGQPVQEYTLKVTDEVSMMTADPPSEGMLFVEDNEGEYIIQGGLPKLDWNVPDGQPPLAAAKKITFSATKEGYLDSDFAEDEVIVLGDVAVGSEAKIVAIPVVNYLVLHDPPGGHYYAV